MNKVKRYIEACHISLKTKPKYMKIRPIYEWIPVDYAPMQDLSIDIKTMPQAFGGYHLLLVITCNQTNFTIAVPHRDQQTQTIAEALIYRVIYLFGPPRWIACNEAAEFTSAIIQAVLTMLNCRLTLPSLAGITLPESLPTFYINICKFFVFSCTQFTYIYVHLNLCLLHKRHIYMQ